MASVVADQTPENHQVGWIDLNGRGIKHALQVHERLHQLHQLRNLTHFHAVAISLHFFGLFDANMHSQIKQTGHKPAPCETNGNSLWNVEQSAVDRIPFFAELVWARHQVVDGNRVQQE